MIDIAADWRSSTAMTVQHATLEASDAFVG